MNPQPAAAEATGQAASRSTQCSELSEPARPQLADGIQLLGEYKDSGYRNPPYLVRRRDGQVIQLSRLLYVVAAAADGHRSLEGIAECVRAETGQHVSVQGLKYLLDEKLNPLGLLPAEGNARALPRARPLFALRAQRTLVREHIVNWLARRLQPLFWWPALAGVLVALVGADYRLLATNGIERGLLAAAAAPAYTLLALPLVVLSVFFHELGHATGCRYSGGRPGPIGVGLYLAWPAFYTNVSDAYRLGRVGRLRTDLGGPYFTAITVCVFAAAYAASDFPPILLAIIGLQFQMLLQLLPVVRFDGYYVLADLVGVPDLFGRIGPILLSVVRRGSGDARVLSLRPPVRRIITVWVLIVVPLLAGYLIALLVYLPGVVDRAAQACTDNIGASVRAAGSDDWGALGVAALQVVTVSLPIIGITLMLTRLAGMIRKLVRRGWGAGGLHRAAVVAGGSASLGGLVVAWWLTKASW